jgi:hypothetical protein
MSPYPHHPKSTKTLLPGEFWPIVLPSGRYACGRVIELTPPNGVLPLRAFLAGILDWVDFRPPTAELIARSTCIYQVKCHIKAISQKGQKIEGFRALEDDGIVPWVMIYKDRIQRGFKDLRAFNPKTDRGLPTLGVAGPEFLDRKAAYLLEKKAT